RVEMKYTWHLNGDSNPYFHPRIVERMGKLWVSSVYMPGSFTSASCPSLTNAAACPSRTTSFAPFLISFLCRVNRCARISFWLGSVHSIMSMNWPFAQSSSPMTALRGGECGTCNAHGAPREGGTQPNTGRVAVPCCSSNAAGSYARTEEISSSRRAGCPHAESKGYAGEPCREAGQEGGTGGGPVKRSDSSPTSSAGIHPSMP